VVSLTWGAEGKPRLIVGNQRFTVRWEFPAKCEHTGKKFFFFHRHTDSGKCYCI